MQKTILIGSLSCLIVTLQPIRAQQPAPAEKIRDTSPDGKFAMRITYDGQMNKELIEGEKADAAKIFSESIEAIELVFMPSKQVVANLLPDEELGGGNNFDDITLIWAKDSKWCAFYWHFPRVGYTTVYNQQGDKFVELNKPDELRVDVKGDVRDEFIQPIKWTKPGTLVLEQLSIFRGDTDDSKLQLTVSFDTKGKFHVINKKNLPPDVKKEE
jgi:hypothetical protein